MDLAQTIENIRFALALTGDSAALVTDDEIETYIGLYTQDWRLAAAALADALAARAINRPTAFGAPGKMNVSWANRADMWMRIAKQLRQSVADDDKLAAGTGTISVAQLTRIGIVVEDPEYTPERRARNRGTW